MKTTVEILIGSGHAMQLAWGAERTVLYNDAYAPMLGERHPAALGIHFRLAWPDVWQEIAPLVDRVFAGETMRFEDMPLVMTRHGRLEDTWWNFSYSPVRDESGEVAGLLNVTVDATGNVRAKQAEAALRESEARLLELAETLEQQVATRTFERDRMWNFSPDLMVEASLDGVYHRANPAWQSILGYMPDEVVGKTAADFTHAEDIRPMLDALSTVQAEMLPSVNLRFRHADGSFRWIQWVAAPRSGLIFAIGRDVTAAVEAEKTLRETEEVLRHSQKMKAVGQLTGGVAHDFNNLLTIIRSSVDFLRRPDLPPARRERYLDAASDTVDRAAKLTGQLLAFARRQALKPVFLGADAAQFVQPGPFVHAFVWLIAVPLGLAMACQLWAARSVAGVHATRALGLLPVPATAVVLFIVIAAVLPQIGPARAAVLGVAPLYIVFAVLAPLAGLIIARIAGLGAPAGRAIAFSGATRNSLVVLPLALAVPGAIPIIPAVIVAQTLVELTASLVYIRLMPLFGSDGDAAAH